MTPPDPTAKDLALHLIDPRPPRATPRDPETALVYAMLYVGDQFAALNETLREMSFEHVTSAVGAKLGRSLRVRATTYRG